MTHCWPEPPEFPTLAEEAIHLWWVPLDRAPIEELEFAAVLSASERQRADGFALDAPRNAFVASRAALRTLLGRYLDAPPQTVQIEIDPNGKPQLADGELRFNLAHSAAVSLIAVTRGCEIGVDIERVRPIDRADEIASRNFHPAEQAAIRAANSSERVSAFMRVWTRKEAALKSLGVGLGYPLDAFQSIAPEKSDGPVELPAAASFAAARCWLHDVELTDDYCAAVATLKPRGLWMGFTYSL